MDLFDFHGVTILVDTTTLTLIITEISPADFSIYSALAQNVYFNNTCSFDFQQYLPKGK